MGSLNTMHGLIQSCTVKGLLTCKTYIVTGEIPFPNIAIAGFPSTVCRTVALDAGNLQDLLVSETHLKGIRLYACFKKKL